MKTITYEYEKMMKAGQLLNRLAFCGVSQARIIAELGDILDSGKIGEIFEKEVDEDGVHSKTVHQDKLEKPAKHIDSTGGKKP